MLGRVSGRTRLISHVFGALLLSAGAVSYLPGEDLSSSAAQNEALSRQKYKGVRGEIKCKIIVGGNTTTGTSLTNDERHH